MQVSKKTSKPRKPSLISNKTSLSLVARLEAIIARLGRYVSSCSRNGKRKREAEAELSSAEMRSLVEYLKDNPTVRVAKACTRYGISYEKLREGMRTQPFAHIFYGQMQMRQNQGRRPEDLETSKVLEVLRRYAKELREANKISIYDVCKEAGISYYLFRKNLPTKLVEHYKELCKMAYVQAAARRRRDEGR